MEELIKKKMNVADASGWYLAEPTYRTWMEDFADEDTGEVVQIERKEVIAPTGDQLTPITISMLEANGVTEVFVSNKKITGKQQKRLQLWQVEVITPHATNPLKEITSKYIIPKGSPLECEVFFNEWAQTNITGSFAIKKIIPLDYEVAILPYDDEMAAAKEKGVCLDYYKVVVKDIEGIPTKILILADNLITAQNAVADTHKDGFYGGVERIFEIKELDICKFFHETLTPQRYFLSLYNLKISATDTIQKAVDNFHETLEELGAEVIIESHE